MRSTIAPIITCALLATARALAQGCCCQPQPSGGCADTACRDTVCAFDSYCCQTQWDSICVNHASSACSVAVPYCLDANPQDGQPDVCSTGVNPADCNGDGVVDYGQILAGELNDANGNNIPDCCEQGSECPGNLVANGGFEAGTPLNACASETIASGNALGTGWMVAAGSVQRVRASASCTAQGTPRSGDFFVDLLDAGEIRQTIATTPGRSYRLTLWQSGDCAGGPTTKRVTASLGATSTTFDHDCVGTGVQAWRSCTVEFIANAAITTLSLKSAAGGATNGPLIDGVRVEDISISCPGDVDGDGAVTGGDIGLVLLNFGDCPSNSAR